MRAAIIGYGKSGKAAEKILRGQGYKAIDIYDDGNHEMLPTADFTDTYDCVVVSPGIDLRKMANAPANYTSEIELAHKLRRTGTAVVAVTGTNGKSTVTSLTAQLLNNCGMHTVACGNIGLTYGDAVSEDDYTAYVVELSSFQSGMLHEFSCDCAVITNLAEDHMDRYADMDEYAADKINLLKFLKPGGRLVIEDDPYLAEKASVYSGETVKIAQALDTVPSLKDGKLDFGKFYVYTEKFPLKGGHNIMNLSYALLAVDSVIGLKGDVTPLISNLKGLEHRCEHVAEIGGVEYINDSKGTNIHSTLTALRGFEPGVIVILGGKDKNGDFTALIDVLNEKAAAVIAYGYAGDKIYKTLEGRIKAPLYKTANLEEAVRKSGKVAKAGEKVVLTPACASFDEHRNFEHRGEHFKELVDRIRVEANARTQG